MKAATAFGALLCLLCALGAESARLSVFRTEFNGVPGRTVVILHSDGDGTNPAAALPGGLDWLVRQMDLLRAVQTHMMLSLAPGLPSDLDAAPQTQQPEDTLRRVGCQRMRQAMLAQEQGIWRSEFGRQTAKAADPLQNKLECYNIHGEPVPCTSDEAVMQDNWIDIDRPVDPATHSAPRPTRNAATSTEPLEDWEVVDGDSIPRPVAAGSERLQADNNDDDEDALTPWSSSSTSSSASSTAAGGSLYSHSASRDPNEDLSDLLFFDPTPQERPPLPQQQQWRRQSAEQPPQAAGSMLLAAGAAFGVALVTIAAAVVLVLALVRRRCAPDALLVAPLLAPTDVYGVKVAACEAAREDVKGIDTSAALLKGHVL